MGRMREQDLQNYSTHNILQMWRSIVQNVNICNRAFILDLGSGFITIFKENGREKLTETEEVVVVVVVVEFKAY